MDSNQTPLQEAQERIAQGLPGLGLAAQAVGLEDHRRLLAGTAQRLRDSHAAQMRAAGHSPAEPGGDDVAGDIVICGDISVSDPTAAASMIDALRGKPAAAASGTDCQSVLAPSPVAALHPVVSAMQSTAAKLAPWLLGAAAIAGGPAGYGLAKWMTPAAAAVVAPVAQPATQPAQNVYDIVPWRP